MFQNAYRGKTVFVTGHTGFKGSWLSLWLHHLGAKVVGYSLYVPSEPSHYHALPRSIFEEDIQGDIRDFEKLDAAIRRHRPDVVFHLAAMPIVSECYESPAKAFQTNLMGSVNVLEAVRASRDVKALVMITSDKCYENVEWLYGYRENDALGGADPYSASKACAEIAISSYARSYFADSGTMVASVRAGNVIGGGDWANNRVIPDAIRAYSQGKPLEIRSPQSTRPWQLVLEPLSGYLWLGAQMLNGDRTVAGEAYNFGPKFLEDYTVKQVITQMQQHIPLECHFGTSSSIKREAKLLKLNCDKARSMLNWTAALSFEQTIALTCEWYKSFYEKGPGETLALSTGQIDAYCGIARGHQVRWSVA
jgi:CDP-glucose 4,6-dehydratase